MVVWQSDPLSVVGLTLEVAVGTAYVVATRRARHRRVWPWTASVAFLAGLAALALVLQSGLASYDENYAVHVVQHVVLMSIAPLLLAFGAPVTLLLRVARPASARRVAAFLHSRFARALCGRRAAVHVPLEYYGLMFVFLLAPVQQLSERYQLVHVSTHLLLLTCGLLFWVPMIGRDPAPWRPGATTRMVAVAAGLPVNAMLSAAAGSWWLLLVSETATLIGLVAVVRPARPSPGRRGVPAQRAAVAPVPAVRA